MMQSYSSVLLAILLMLQSCYAPPVSQDKKGNEVDSEHHNGEDSDIGGLEDYMEYHRYLKEVVNALESDPDFRTKLENADENHIKSGKIAEELEFVSHHVRTRLDEIKRRELTRLKELVEKKIQLEKLDADPNAIDPEDPMHNHLDHQNPHTFEIEDLKKLIAKTTEDLAEADKKRKEDFKKYEMEKELKKQEKLNSTNGEEREKLEKQFEELESKHKTHERLHEPGHKAQLEEVWQEQDQMQQDFDPKTFFMLHDLDGNGLWDQEEVKALFIKELDKMYQEGAPEDDMRERMEEMERMREAVFKEIDTNRDGFIDFHEFYKQATSNNFKEDHGWKGLDEQTRPYTDEELAQMAQYYHETQRNAGDLGHQGLPIHEQQAYHPQQGYHNPQQGVPQQAYHPQQGGYQQQPNPGGYPNQQQPGGYQQQQGGYQQQQGGYQQQQPQGGYQQPQQPQGGYQQPQQPQGGYQQPQAGNQYQAPPGGYQQVPQGQFQAGQVPQMVPQQLGNQQHPNQVQNQPNQAQQMNSNQIHQQQQNQQPGQVNQPNQHQNQQQQNQPGQVNQHQNQQQQGQANQQHQPNKQPNVQLNQGEHLPNQQPPLVKEQISNIANPQLNMV